MDVLGEYYAKCNDIRQRKANTALYHLHVESKKYNKLVNTTKKNETHRYREQTSGCPWKEGK